MRQVSGAVGQPVEAGAGPGFLMAKMRRAEGVQKDVLPNLLRGKLAKDPDLHIWCPASGTLAAVRAAETGTTAGSVITLSTWSEPHDYSMVEGRDTVWLF